MNISNIRVITTITANSLVGIVMGDIYVYGTTSEDFEFTEDRKSNSPYNKEIVNGA